jgi:hypothetical protein
MALIQVRRRDASRGVQTTAHVASAAAAGCVDVDLFVFLAAIVSYNAATARMRVNCR